jgi:superfamily I DNA/RNA helicase
MKLLFYDKFFDSLIQLPKGIQKKVVDFQKKFRENSKSSGIHLEPISTFKDSSLRTARIDQTYRAIIKSPDAGDTYYLLWVDHHDKAYDWAQNKLFQWNNQVQSMQVFTAPEAISMAEDINEIVIENGLFGAFENSKLLNIGVPEVLLPSIRSINNLDELENIEKFIPAEVFENLFYLTDGANIDHLISEIEEGKLKAEEIDLQVTSINNQRNFIELTDDTLFNEVLSGNLNKWKYYLHPSQRKLVNSTFSGTAKITGGAGTGKTVAALHRLKYLSEKCNPLDKILFTTYTKALTENLTSLAKDLNINESNITIKNIDALAFDLVKEYNLYDSDLKVFGLNAVKSPEEIWETVLETELVAFDSDFLNKEYQDVIIYNNVTSLNEYLRTSRTGRGKPISRRIRSEIWVYLQKYQELKNQLGFYHKEELYNKLFDYLQSNKITPFDYCLVDELQDFSNVELRLIRAFVKEKKNDLFMVGDPLQKIYDRKINFSRIGINVRGKKSRRLRINYRTTEEIKKLAISIINDCYYDNFDGEEEEKNGYVSLFHGVKPIYKVFKTKDAEIQKIVDQIQVLIEGGYKYSDIAISSRTKNGIKDFQSKLHNESIPYYRYESGSWNGNADGVRLLTFHAIKGLEFKQVFLVDVNDRNCTKIPFYFENYSDDEKNNYLRNEKSLLYVAVTRAIENVEISGIGNKSSFITI